MPVVVRCVAFAETSIIALGGAFICICLAIFAAVGVNFLFPAVVVAIALFTLIAARCTQGISPALRSKQYGSAVSYMFIALLWAAFALKGQDFLAFSSIYAVWMEGVFCIVIVGLCGAMLNSPLLVYHPRSVIQPVIKASLPVAAKPLIPQVPICQVCKKRAITDTHYVLCAPCKKMYMSEIQRVRTQKYRAKQLGQPATLTVVEWIQTLQSFHFQCAYCQRVKFECMEHFVPLGYGNDIGTTKENCVPSCVKCNAKKGSKHPEK